MELSRNALQLISEKMRQIMNSYEKKAKLETLK